MVTIYRLIINSYKENQKEIPKQLETVDRMPIHYIIFVMVLPILMHKRMFYPYHINRTVSKFITIGSNGKDVDMIYRGISLYLGYDIK